MDKKQKKKDFSREGQSLIEYIILVAVITVILIAFLAPGGYFESMYQRTIDQQGTDMLNAVIAIFR